MEVKATPDGDLAVTASEAELDRYVLALAAAAIAVRRLEVERHAARVDVFRTDREPAVIDSAATRTLRPRTRVHGAGVAAVCRVELVKLGAQAPARIAAVVCCLGPFAFARDPRRAARRSRRHALRTLGA